MLKKIINQINTHYLLGLTVVAFFYLWDIGNLNAIRQGTEGFYLQISKEMFNQSSFLTPLYMGENHWSKPPLHFWMGILSYKIFNTTSIWAPRFIIFFISIAGLTFISKWTKRFFHINTAVTFLFLASTLGFLKYSRIFMMEIPLAILSVTASLKFFDYLQSKTKKDLLIASLLLGSSCLIKGPVSMVMCLGGCGFFLLAKSLIDKKLLIKPLIFWMILSLILASFWFVASYYQHGHEFFDFFFLRENLGKFSSHNYPYRVLFQGLLIFGLPWSLFFPLIYLSMKNTKFWKPRSQYAEPIFFLTCNFLVFYCVWLIPAQRSHHYAFPSLPFFLLILLTSVFNLKINKRSISEGSFGKVLSYTFIAISTFLFLIIGLLLCFSEINHNYLNIIRILFTLLCFAIGIFFLLPTQTLKKKVFAPILIFGSAWSILAPVFFLPYIPGDIKNAIGKNKLGVVARKPYFIEQAINQKVDVLDPSRMYNYIEKNSHLYLVHKDTYKNQRLDKITKIVKKWSIWKRGNSSKAIFNALKNRDLKSLKDDIFLLSNK